MIKIEEVLVNQNGERIMTDAGNCYVIYVTITNEPTKNY